ncbi:MAG TPA: hypothetical protein VMN58_07830 [Acidimicrobiales bacterium]|nr:hypothetical protein [Acidimicrobiales bacterium]
MSGVVVLHEPGDLAGGAQWVDAFERAGVPGPVRAPDLPGHGSAPAPTGGCYELLDGAMAAAVVGAGDAPALVVGVGASGWSAEVLALGGRAAALVLVDGLGGPWLDARQRLDAGRRWLRDIADDPAAVATPPPGAPDPRAGHGVVDHGSRRLAERAAAVMAVPVLLLETPGSGLARADVDDLATCFATGAEVAHLPDRSPASVAAAVAAWAVRA